MLSNMSHKAPKVKYRSQATFVSSFLRGMLLLMCGAGLFSQAVIAGKSADPIARQHGTRYSALNEITSENVAGLQRAWVYHSADIPESAGIVSYQDAPLFIEDQLITCTPSRELHALDPASGELLWKYAPGGFGGLSLKCKGISAWTDPEQGVEAACKTRLLWGTSDYRLLAVDAKTGIPCADFGSDGVVDIEISRPELFPGEVWALARPAVVNDTVVVGSSVADNQRIASPSGRVMAFHARTGEFLWSFDPIPREESDPAFVTWGGDHVPQNGGANVWSGFVWDEALNLVYLPTTSPTVDFSGTDRPGDNLYSDSVVALNASTGERVWHQQIVHHDIWDYDLPTPGILVDYPMGEELVPALIQNTKQGLIFVFDRRTGEPLVPIEERPVPQQGAMPGEQLSPTQPYPVGMPAVAKQGFSPDDAWGFTPIDRWMCQSRAEELLYGDMYTPISAQGTVVMPSSSGGPDWGGGSFDAASGVMVVPANFVAMIISNLPAEDVALVTDQEVDASMGMTFNNLGAPYATHVEPFLSPLGAPCTEPPWARLTAVDVVNKELLWQVPLGTIERLAPIPIPWELGTPGVGAPLLTAGGLVFLGYSLDHQFRAFDLKTGEVLWSDELPAPATSQPQTYWYEGHQYVVVPAGGHSMYGTELSDALIAYRLP